MYFKSNDISYSYCIKGYIMSPRIMQGEACCPLCGNWQAVAVLELRQPCLCGLRPTGGGGGGGGG